MMNPNNLRKMPIKVQPYRHQQRAYEFTLGLFGLLPSQVRSGGAALLMGKKKKGVDCHNINYADFQLRRISASILGLRDFKDSAFEEDIEKIVVLDDGSLEYHFYEGRTETWQRM